MLAQQAGFDPRQEPDPRVRWRAWRMWIADGCPHGRQAEYLARARELQLIDDSPVARSSVTGLHRPRRVEPQ